MALVDEVIKINTKRMAQCSGNFVEGKIILLVVIRDCSWDLIWSGLLKHGWNWGDKEQYIWLNKGTRKQCVQRMVSVWRGKMWKKGIRGDWLEGYCELLEINRKGSGFGNKMIGLDLDTLTSLSENGKQGFEILGLELLRDTEVVWHVKKTLELEVRRLSVESWLK